MDDSDSTIQYLGKYRLVRLLGKGGFAKVYLGTHVQLGTQAAIKMLSARLTDTAIAQFLTEARTIARLEHPHIIRILDYEVEEDVPFLVMYYASNGTLRQRYPKGTRVPLETIRTYLQQAADAIQYAHNAKLIHRDIKPANMLLGPKNELLLSDFGIAVIAHSSRSQQTGDVAGTISYMAPEQIKGKPHRASDQYALAVIVYEWLCGLLPFQGNREEIVVQHMYTEPPSLCTHIPNLPSSIDLVIRQALAKDPHQRFSSIQEFATAFEQASQDWLVSSTGTSKLQRSTLSNRTSQISTLPNNMSQLSTLSDPIPQIPAPSDPIPALNHAEHASTRAQQPVQPAKKAQHSKLRRAFLLGTLGTLGVAAVSSAVTLEVALHENPQQATPPHKQTTPNRQLATPGQTLVTFTGHTAPVVAVAWSPDSAFVASGSDDRTVQVWPTNLGTSPSMYQGPSNMNAVAWSPPHTNQRIASAGGTNMFKIPGGNVVQIWSPSSEAPILTYKGHAQPVSTVAWSPDGTRIASAGEDNTVQVWESSTGTRFFSFTKHTSSVTAVAWSPDGTRVASASLDATVQIWDAQTASPLAVLSHSNVVNAIAWSPDGTRIAAAIGNNFFGGDHKVQIWEVATRTPILNYRGHTYPVTTVAWSPNSAHLASACSLTEKTVQVWDARTGATILTYRGHTLNVLDVAWSPDGTRIASASNDGTARVWVAP